MDRNSFHLAHPAASGASQPGMAVAYEFYEVSRGANHTAMQMSAAMEPTCRQYRAARWFLLPEAGLRQRLDGRSWLSAAIRTATDSKILPVQPLFRKRPPRAPGGRFRQARCTAIGFQKVQGRALPNRNLLTDNILQIASAQP